MIRRPLFLFLLPLGLVGCGGQPEPEPDPVELAKFVASLEDDQKEPSKADRLFASVENIPPERIDPNVALAAFAK